MRAEGGIGPTTTPRGRDDIVGRLERDWITASAGRSVVRVIRGEAGIGKTTVLAGFARRLGDRAVRVTAYGGPEAPRLAVIDDLRHRLCGGEPSATGDTGDPSLLEGARALIGDVRRRAAEGPVAVLVDDAHDLEPASRRTLGMVLHWLSDEPVLVVLATRPRPQRPELVNGFGVIEIGPLAVDDAAAVVRGAVEGPVAPGAVDRLVALAGGVPLILTELPRSLSLEVLEGRAPIPDPMPADGVLEEVFGPRLDALSDAGRELVELLALTGDAGWDAVADRLGPITRDAVVDAERAGLVVVERGRPSLVHQLLGSTVLARLAPDRRRALHRQLAGSPVLPPGARLTHRALAAVGPSPDLVAELVEAARAMVLAGDPEGAGHQLELAAGLAPVGEEADRIRLSAAIALADGGAVADAAQHLECLATDGVAGVRDEAVRRAALLDALHGQPVEAWQRLQAQAAATDDPAVRGRAHAAMSLPLGMLGLTRQIVTEATAAVELSPVGSRTRFAAQLTLFHANAAIEPQEPAGLLEVVSDRSDWRDVLAEDPVCGLHVGRAVALVGRFQEGERILAAMRAAGAGGPSLALTLGALGELRVRSCRWVGADHLLTEAIGSCMTMGQQAFTTFWLALRCRLRALTGDAPGAANDLRLGLDIATDRGLVGARYFLQASAGLVLGLSGDHAGAIDALEECAMFEDLGGALVPNLARWRPELVELYLAADRRADAERATAVVVDAAGAQAADQWTRGVAHRLTGLLAAGVDDEAALVALDRAVEVLDADTDRFDHARALHLRAGVCERLGDARGATADGRRATFLLQQLGAKGWPRDGLTGGASTLTAVERTVMGHVAEGLTNRQIATAMGLSPKTVANHLYRIYRRLGVSSRIEALQAVEQRGGGVG